MVSRGEMGMGAATGFGAHPIEPERYRLRAKTMDEDLTAMLLLCPDCI